MSLILISSKKAIQTHSTLCPELRPQVDLHIYLFSKLKQPAL